MKRFAVKIINAPRFVRQYFQFRRAKDERFGLKFTDLTPCLADNTKNTYFDAHYIYHTSWAARILSETRPTKHVDISSSLYFCSIVSSFIPVEFYDYRPAEIRLAGLECQKGDLLNLPFEDSSIQSLSCMHTVEHVGLGRYGDPLDPTGDISAMAELKRVVAKGGDFLFVVPIGRPRIMFNAHRIYSYRQIVDEFKDLELKEFSLIPDDQPRAGLIRNASEEMADAQRYGCGCFWFRKPERNLK